MGLFSDAICSTLTPIDNLSGSARSAAQMIDYWLLVAMKTSFEEAIRRAELVGVDLNAPQRRAIALNGLSRASATGA